MSAAADHYAQQLSIVYALRLAESPTLRTFVHDRTRQAQLGGAIPTERKPPADDSGVAIAVAPSGHWAGFATFYETTDGRLWLDVLWVEQAWIASHLKGYAEPAPAKPAQGKLI